jgi:hypothetical protein
MVTLCKGRRFSKAEDSSTSLDPYPYLDSNLDPDPDPGGQK